MDRVNAANFVTLSGRRTFADPNLTLNQLGTMLAALWHAGVQESILGVIEAAGITPADASIGAQDLQLLQAILAISGKHIQVFSSSGTFVTPNSVTKVKARGWGAGGGSGGVSGANAAASGGSGGGYFEGIYAVSGSIAVTIGTGGLGGVAPANGTPGGTTSFGTLASATGGVGGISSTGGIAAAPTSAGTGTGGALNQVGRGGGIGIQSATLFLGGLGGGSFGSPNGGGLESGAVPSNASFPGQGADGAATTTSATWSGSVGANGLIILEW